MRVLHFNREITQLPLSDLGCGKHTCLPHTEAKNPVHCHPFSTDQELVGGETC